MRNNQITWYELQLLSKGGYTAKKLEELQREARDSFISYEQILELELQKVQRIRSRVN